MVCKWSGDSQKGNDTLKKLCLPALSARSWLCGLMAFASTTLAVEELTIRASRADALYKKGEEATFHIAASGPLASLQEIRWRLSKDGLPMPQSGKIKLVDGKATITGTLEEPGFLRCHVEAVDQNGKSIKAMGAAGFSPDELKASSEPPSDFDSYWDEQKALLALIPMEVSRAPVKTDAVEVVVEDLRIAALGTPVSGYYAKPAHARKGGHPAILFLHGAGVRSSLLQPPIEWAKNGMLALDINAHGLPNGQPDEFYKTLGEDFLRTYSLRQKVSRDHHYFVGMYLRVLRALDFLAAQPEWDGRHLIAYGTSQGGAQAVVAASLDPRVSFFVAGVPAYADVTGAQADRAPGWPRFVKDGSGKTDLRAVEVARYFDTVNFIRRTKADGFFTVGFIDDTCPPTSVYTLFNTLQGKKAIYNSIADGHKNTPEARKQMRAAVLKHVAEFP